MLKTVGYLISSVSVVCLGVVAWSSAAQKPLMLAFLLVGMGTSVLGMLLRWTEHQREKRERERDAELRPASRNRPFRSQASGRAS